MASASADVWSDGCSNLAAVKVRAIGTVDFCPCILGLFAISRKRRILSQTFSLTWLAFRSNKRARLLPASPFILHNIKNDLPEEDESLVTEKKRKEFGLKTISCWEEYYLVEDISKIWFAPDHQFSPIKAQKRMTKALTLTLIDWDSVRGETTTVRVDSTRH